MVDIYSKDCGFGDQYKRTDMLNDLPMAFVVKVTNKLTDEMTLRKADAEPEVLNECIFQESLHLTPNPSSPSHTINTRHRSAVVAGPIQEGEMFDERDGFPRTLRTVEVLPTFHQKSVELLRYLELECACTETHFSFSKWKAGRRKSRLTVEDDSWERSVEVMMSSRSCCGSRRYAVINPRCIQV